MRGMWALGAILITAAPAAAQDFALRGRLGVGPATAEASNESLSRAVLTPLPAPTETPAALNASKGRYNLALAPHARENAFGGTDAGAELRVTRDLGKRRAGDDGRYFLYAAASGQSVELPPHAEWADGDRSSFVSDAKAGVGWRKGNVETSVGYVRRKVQTTYSSSGLEKRGGGMVGVSLTLRPGG